MYSRFSGTTRTCTMDKYPKYFETELYPQLISRQTPCQFTYSVTLRSSWYLSYLFKANSITSTCSNNFISFFNKKGVWISTWANMNFLYEPSHSLLEIWRLILDFFSSSFKKDSVYSLGKKNKPICIPRTEGYIW